MKRRQIHMLMLAVVFVVLCAVFLGIRQYNKAHENQPEEVTAIAVNDVNPEDIVRFSYDYEGVTYTFEKEEETWYYADDHDQALRQYTVGNIVEGVAPLMADQVIENVTDLSQYGLTEPQRRITYETETESCILYVGDLNSVTSSYYVCFPSDATVYVIQSANINRFNKTIEDLLESS